MSEENQPKTSSYERMEDHADYQRKSMMSQSERDVNARNEIAGEIKAHNEKLGREVTHEQAVRQATEIAERAEKNRR